MVIEDRPSKRRSRAVGERSRMPYNKSVKSLSGLIVVLQLMLKALDVKSGTRLLAACIEISDKVEPQLVVNC